MRRRDGNREEKTADNLPKVVQKYRDRKKDRGRAQRQAEVRYKERQR